MGVSRMFDLTATGRCLAYTCAVRVVGSDIMSMNWRNHVVPGLAFAIGRFEMFSHDKTVLCFGTTSLASKVPAVLLSRNIHRWKSNGLS